MKRALMALLLLACVSLPASAVMPDEILSDPAAEARARNLSAGFRCLVCQNESIDDSSAPLAKDLRLLVRERIVAGDSDQQVRDFLVARYGQFVLLRPPFSTQTFLLYTAPFFMLGLGAFMLWHRAKSVRIRSAQQPLSDEEKARINERLSR